MPAEYLLRIDQPSHSSDTKRLHITPLTETLLPRILGAYLPVAKDISFHHLPNFPNKDYGFLTLPLAEAAMVKKKLHGTILRGEKVAVEDARPDLRKEKVDKEIAEDMDAEPESEPQGRALRKRKREVDVITAAVVLPEDRKVKRGWTETKAQMEAKKVKEKKEKQDGNKSKKSKAKTSSYTDQAECLFETSVPENAVKDNSSKERRDGKKNKKGKETVTIHEFEHTTKYPSYLRQGTSDKKKVQEYDEQKGWVDEEGTVVETVKAISAHRKITASNPQSDTLQDIQDQTVENGEGEEFDQTSSSGSSEAEQSSEDSEADDEPDEVEQAATKPASDIAVSITASSPVAPHPLETLFKKPKAPLGATKANLEIDTSFSFFSNNDDEVGSDDDSRPQIEKSLETPGLPTNKRRGLPNLSIPVTPYSQKDLNWRAQRSAAPTPDTAAPGKSSFGDPFGLLSASREREREREDDIEEEDEDEPQDDVMQGVETEDSTTADDKGEAKESEFSKWFWENRGTNTKAWKKRKKDAAKEQRSRESRKRKG